MNENAIDRNLVCAFIAGLISDDGERKKGLEYIRNMPPVETHDKRTKTHACDYIHRQDVLDLAKKGVLISNGNYESVCKAINELPPVKPQPCEDAIDRAEAIKIASGYCHPANVAKELAKLPPVTPQPKIGRWVENDRGISICSCCGKDKYEDIDGSIYDDVWFPNYCPNCGAKMFEPQKI